MVIPKYISKPIKVGRKTAPNRIVYQPTESNNGDSLGSVTDTTIKKYTALAKGGPGIIFVESLDVTLKTQARTNRLTILPENLPGLKKLVSEVRAANADTLVLFQLSHAGALSDPSLKPPVFVYVREGEPHKAMTTAEVEAARDEFIEGTVVAHAAGADGVDVKQAHGFLAGDFLHPANLRQDRYGGSYEKRTRFFREIIEGIRLKISDPGFIIGTRISPYEGVPGGCGTAEPDGLVEDLTEVLGYAKQLDVMDMVGLGRQAIADPLTAGKLLSKNINIDWCTTCGACGALLGNQKAVGCPVYNPEYK